MKKILMLASAVAMIAAPAFAQSYADGLASYTINSNVPSFCKFGSTGNGFGEIRGGNPGAVDAANGDATFVMNIQNPVDNTVLNVGGEFKFSNAQCNTAFTITATSTNGGLKNTATTSDPLFTNNVHYIYAMKFDGINNHSDAYPADAGKAIKLIDSDEARAGNAQFDFTVPGSQKLLLAGAYTDTVLITLSPKS